MSDKDNFIVRLAAQVAAEERARDLARGNGLQQLAMQENPVEISGGHVPGAGSKGPRVLT